jgi:PAS domain S-box-containing protein
MTPEKPTRVLYMEDDEGLAQLLKKKLERQGFSVDLAANGEEGLRMFDPDDHQIIAVDQNMPILDGLEVIKILATYAAIPPIVMVTGTGDERVAVEAMKLGARDYIVKDVDGGYLELLPSVIKQVLYQQRLIDEKRKAEETLRQSEERYRSLVELSPDGIVVYHDNTLVFVNEAATRLLLARRPRDLIGRKLVDFIHPASYVTLWSRLERTEIYGEQVTFLEGQLVRLDGQPLDVEIMAAPVMFENRSGTQMIIRDITERKRAQEVQRESDRLRLALEKETELGELKTRFMITISHEFRTPLSVAYTSAELLERYYDRMDGLQRHEHLNRVEGQIKKLTEMLEDISMIIHSRFERLGLTVQPVDLRQLSEAAISQIEDYEEVHQRILFTVEEDLPNLLLDVRRIKYVLTNLLSNALKYSESDKMVRLDVSRHKDGIMIIVADQGIGIPLEEQAHIFDPFYRAHNVGQIRGTGLGLSIVKEIVELHRGVVTIKSEVNLGTKITVYLPQQ